MAESATGREQPETPETETSLPDSLSQRLEQLRREMASALETAGQEAIGEVLAAVAAIDGARSQAGVLAALLDGGARFAGRTAFFLTRPEGIRGWAAQGFGRGGSAIEGLDLNHGDSAWAALAEGAGVVRLSADDCAELSARIDAEPGAEGVLVPFVLRGQLGGALYADRRRGEARLGVVSLQLLTHSAAQALETLAARPGVSPALREFEAGAAAALPLWQEPAEELEAPAVEMAEPEPEPAEEELPAQAAVAEELVEEPAEISAAAEPSEAAVDFGFEPPEAAAFEPREEELGEEPEPELEDTSMDIWALEEEEEPTQAGLETTAAEAVEPRDVREAAAPEAAAPEAARDVPAEAVGQQTVRLDIATLQDQQPGVSPPAQEFRPPEEEPVAAEPVYELEPAPVEPAPVEPVPVEPVPVEPVPVEPVPVEPVPVEPVAPPVDDSETPTIISSQPLAGAEYVPPAPEPAAPVPEPAAPAPEETRPEPAGGSQVQPPTDLQGPGSAFLKAASVSEIAEGEEALHEEARRLARLLVSEIKLYNEEIIEEGRRNGDIYDRLKDDIDRSRQMYEERIDPRLHGKEDYFHQELVQRLAGGNEGLLGI